MRHNRIQAGSRKAVLWMLTVLLLFQAWTACQGGRIPSETTADPNETAPSGGDGFFTLSPGEGLTEPNADPLPPLMDLDPAAPYAALVITAYYAAGNVAGKAMAAASFVELHNGDLRFASEPGTGTRVTVTLYGKAGDRDEP